MTTLSELVRLQEELPGKQWAIDGDGRPGMEWNNFIVQAEARHMTVCFMAHSPEDNSKLEKAAEFIAAARNFDLKGLATQYEAMRAALKVMCDHCSGCGGTGSISKLNRIGDEYYDEPCELCYEAHNVLASLDTKARGDE